MSLLGRYSCVLRDFFFFKVIYQKYDILLLLVDLYVNIPRFFATFLDPLSEADPDPLK